MKVRSISNPELFKVFNQETNECHYGCNQEWYSTEWQRLSGCGPTVATNIIYYLTRKGKVSPAGQGMACKTECSALMEDVWKYVTPTTHGIPETKMLIEAMLSYVQSKKLNFEYQFLDLPEDRDSRPTLAEVLDFLETAFIKDAPVAFLNLCNGGEQTLDEWHWVTIISLGYRDKEEQIYVNILDEGMVKKIDLALWYNTTTLGGGFVYFSVPCE